MGKLISKKEAAAILGCAERTIEDWLNHGLLRGHAIKRTAESTRPYTYVDSDSIASLQDVTDDIVALRKQLEDVREQLRQDLADEQRRACIGTPQIHDLIVAAIRAACSPDLCSPRSADIMMAICANGRPVSEVAAELGLSKQRVQQIVQSETRHLIKRYERLRLAYDNEVSVAVEKAALEQENRALRKELEKYSAPSEEAIEMEKLLSTRLADCELSVRALNCLKHAEIETLGDLVACKRTDLLKFRNFGKKSIEELDRLLISQGLSWKS